MGLAWGKDQRSEVGSLRSEVGAPTIGPPEVSPAGIGLTAKNAETAKNF
jgi:hypothetical protein